MISVQSVWVDFSLDNQPHSGHNRLSRQETYRKETNPQTAQQYPQQEVAWWDFSWANP